MVRRIMVPLDPSPYAAAALEFACHIAKSNNAELTGMTILDVPGIKKHVGPSPIGGMYYAEQLLEKYKREAGEHIDELVKNFSERCEKDGINYRLSGYQGSPSQRISEVSIYFDLIVAGLKTYYRFRSEGSKGNSIDNILDHSITSMIAVPKDFQPPETDKRMKVLVAFDGSKPAGRALHRFAAMGANDQYDIEILMAHSDKEVAEYHLERAARYLTVHSFKSIKTQWTSMSAINAVEELYIDQVQAVVLGVHSKKSILDFRLGSLSRHLIQRADKLLYLVQ